MSELSPSGLSSQPHITTLPAICHYEQVWIHSRATAAPAAQPGCDLPLFHAAEDGHIGETSASGTAPISRQVLVLVLVLG